MKTIVPLIVVLCFSALLVTPLGAAAPEGLSDAGVDLLATYPGAMAHREGDRLFFFGKPMTAGATAEDAVQQWLQNHAVVFGDTALDLRLERRNEVGVAGNFEVFVYEPLMDGLPIEGVRLRLLIHHGIQDERVVFVSAEEIAAPTEGFSPDLYSAEEAVQSVQTDGSYSNLDRWSTPTQVVLRPTADNGLVEPVRAWTFMGWTSNKTNYQAFAFFVDASSAALVEVRNEVHNINVEGTVAGFATPGILPDVSYNLPVLTNIEGALVRLVGGSTVFSDENGAFDIFNIGTQPVDIESELLGQWVDVNNDQGADQFLNFPGVVPPGNLDILYNPSPAEFVTAQVNAFIHTTGVHDFYKDRQPGYTALDLVLPANCNLTDTCNAFFSGAEININFFGSGGGCPNTAFSNVVYHEYGHFIVNRLNLAQGAFGEGFSDCVALLAFDNPIIGVDFFGPGTSVRDIPAANVQYPCPGTQVHFCGQIIGGVWWDLRQEFGAVYGSTPGLESTQQLFTDWSQITGGGQGANSAHPGTAVEVLIVDDDDGDLTNGTPNFFSICAAFGAHSIDCPPIPAIFFQFPNGTPDLVAPNAQFTFPVNVLPNILDPVAGTAMLFVSSDGGPFQAQSMVENMPNEYTATLPASICTTEMDYYVSAQAEDGSTVTFPTNAPAATLSTVAATGLIEALDDNMESNLGWTVGDAADDATTGIWERVDPVGTTAQPEDDHTPAGIRCWVTGQHTGGGQGSNDVDGGQTTLTTPVLDMSTAPDFQVSYWRWYANNTGSSVDDIFVVEISDQGGAPGSWVNVETVGPTGPEAGGGWFLHEFNVTDLVTPTSEVVIRFIASDEGSGSIVEAAVDDFRAVTVECGPPFSRGDCNQDGARNISDAVRVLDGIFGGGAPFDCEDACDADDSGDLGLPDAFALLDALFAGTSLPGPFPGCGTDLTDDGMDCDQPLGCP